MADFLVGMLTLSMQASIAGLIVLAARKLLGRNLSANMRCLLWLVVFVRMVMPINIPNPISIFNLVSVVHPVADNRYVPSFSDTIAEPHTETQAFESHEVSPISPISPIEATSTQIHNLNIDYATLLFIIMMATSVALLIHALLQYRQLRKCFGNEEIVYSNVPAPFVFGLIKPTIVLPLGMENEALKVALCHEKMHVKLKHHIVKLLLTVFRKGFWFNPFIYLFCAAVDSDLELSCDECVLKLTDEQGEKLIKPNEYVEAMLSVAVFKKTQLASVNSIVSCFVKNNLKKRAERILTMKKTSKIIIVIMSAITGLLAISLITNAQASNQFSGTTLIVNETDVNETDTFAPSISRQVLDEGELNSVGFSFIVDIGNSTWFCIKDGDDKIHTAPTSDITGMVTSIVGFTAHLSGWVDYDPADFTNLVLTRDGVAIEKRYIYTKSEEMNQFSEWHNQKSTSINFAFRREISEPGVYRLTGKYKGNSFVSSFVIVEDTITNEPADPKAMNNHIGFSGFWNERGESFILEFEGVQQSLFISDITELKVTHNDIEVAFELCGHVVRSVVKSIYDNTISTRYSICFAEPFTESGIYRITGKYMGVEFVSSNNGREIMIHNEAEVTLPSLYLHQSDSSPVNTAEEIENNDTDYVERPFLGIIGFDVTEDMIEIEDTVEMHVFSSQGVSEYIIEKYSFSSQGVSVYYVVEDSAAQYAGIEPLDLIVRFNDTEIATMEQLWDTMGDYNVGDRVTVDLYRDGLNMQFEVVLDSFKQ